MYCELSVALCGNVVYFSAANSMMSSIYFKFHRRLYLYVDILYRVNTFSYMYKIFEVANAKHPCCNIAIIREISLLVFSTAP